MSQIRLIRVFLSSPGDVTEERQIALEVIERLPNRPAFREKVAFRIIAWDKPGAGTPMRATLTPQEAINNGLPQPSECDIVVVIFWSRMGTPFTIDSREYQSGTHWELLDALQSERPQTVMYRRTQEVLFKASDMQGQEQYKRVEAFLKSDLFYDPDTGAIRRGVNTYQTPDNFRQQFETHFEELVVELLQRPTLESPSEPVPENTPNITTITTTSWLGSPFPGLRAFTPADAPIYFGRGHETDALVQRVAANRFVAVVGASGSGKSSLVGAGLIPRLKAGAISGSKDWLLPDWNSEVRQWVGLRFTPGEVGDNPFMALALKLAPLTSNTSRELAETLAKNPSVLTESCVQLLKNKPEWAEVLIFIDQFEELFTLVHPQYITPFVELLETVIKSQQIRTVATLRADFYARCVAVPKLADILETTTFPLAAPTQTELRQMIIRPAEQAGLEFEAGLPERILDDTGTEPGALALMAYALDELYHSGANDHQLTETEYEALGGVQGAIGKRAETIFHTLDTDAQNALPTVFQEIVEVDERGEPTRRRAELQVIAPDAAAKRLVDALTGERARLLVQDRDGQGHPIVEVAHEALLRQWPRLKGWIEHEQDNLRRRRQIQQAAQEWETHERTSDYLLTGSRLEDAQRWLKVFSVGQLERDYIAASADTEARRKEEDRKIAQRVLNFQRAIVVFAVIGLLVIIATLVAFNTQQTSASATLAAQVTQVAQQRDQAQSLIWANSAQTRWNNGKGDGLLALALALKANQVANPPPLAQRLLADIAYYGTPSRIITGPPNTYAVSFSHDTRSVLSYGRNEDLVIWDADTGTEIRRFSEAVADIAVWSPDGNFIASLRCCTVLEEGSGESTLQLWDIASGELAWETQTPYVGIKQLGFSQDERFIVAISPASPEIDEAGIHITLWSMADGKEINRFTVLSAESTDYAQSVPTSSAPVVSVLTPQVQRFPLDLAFSPSGHLIIVDIENNALVFFDVETGKELRRLAWNLTSEEYYPARLSHLIAFSPSGQEILIQESGGVSTWNTDNGAQTGTLETGQSSTQIYISYDGERLSTVEENGSITLWDHTTGQAISQFNLADIFLPSSIEEIAFTHDGQVARVLTKNQIIDWDTRTGAEIGRLPLSHSQILDAAFDADGSHVIFSSLESQSIMPALSPVSVVPSVPVDDAVPPVPPEPADSAVPPVPAMLNMQVWNAADNTLVSDELESTFKYPWITVTSFSPDRQYLLLAVESNGHVTLRNLADHSETELVPGTEEEPHVTSAAFSPDGQSILIGKENGELILWDMSTGTSIQILSGHTTSIHHIAWSPDGDHVVSAGWRGELILWDMSTRTLVRRFEGHSDRVSSATFSPDGQYILSGGDFGEIILWNTQGNIIERFISPEESDSNIASVAFSPDGSTVASGGASGHALIWDVASGVIIRQFLVVSNDIKRVSFSPDGKSLLAVSDQGLHLWRFDTPAELVDWTLKHRYLRELTCQERVAYQILPYCDLFPTQPPLENLSAG